MRLSRALVATLVSGLLAACQGDSEPGPGPGPGGTGELRGGERLAWDQLVEDAATVNSLRFRLWIDDLPDEMSGISCEPAAPSSACSGVLPGMSGGPHTLALSAVAADGTEGPRSTPLQVTVVASGTGGRLIFHDGLPALADTSPAAMAGDSSTGGGGAADGVDVQTLTDALIEPTDIVALPDGRVVVAERRGVVRLLVDGVLRAEPMLTLDDVSTEGGSGLLSLALDPDFPRNGLVYLGYTAETGFRIARHRIVDGRLGERSIVFETSPDRPYAAAVLRFGPDRQLYVGLDDEGDASRGGDLGAVSGKLLRLNSDGSVPRDQPGFSPVYAASLRAPRALDWSVAPPGLWVAEGSGPVAGLLTVLQPGGADRRAAIVARYAMPDADVPVAAAFYHGAAFQAWTGDLLVGLGVSGQLLRLRLDPADGTRVSSTAIVLDGSAGPIRALSLGVEGAVYVAGDHTLLRLTPSPGP